jgi:tRNA1(Val) A37 N6-methylase TrmN6
MESLINDIKSDFRTEINKNDPKIKRKAKLAGELYNLTMQQGLFEVSKAEQKERKKQIAKLEIDLNKLDTVISEIKSNAIYEDAFEWRFEFPEVLDDKGNFVGFDVVIGNPPYVFGGNEGISKIEKNFFKNNYKTGSGKINLFTLFIELSSNIMANESEFGFIIPNTFLRVTSYDLSRRFLLSSMKINNIYDFGDKVFENAITTAIVLTANKNNSNDKDYWINVINNDKNNSLNKSDIVANNYVISISTDSNAINLIKKLKSKSVMLGTLCEEMIFGVVITKNKNEIVSNERHAEWKPFLEGKEIGRYYIAPVTQWLNYQPELLHRARTKEIFEVKEKILIQRITGGKRPLKATYDNQQHYNKESINNIILYENALVSTKFILALLNSNLINWFYSIQFTNESNLTVNLSKTYLSQLPIYIPSENRMVEIENSVDQILSNKSEDPTADTTSLEQEIDQMVYELYGLTDEEINIVEGSVG